MTADLRGEPLPSAPEPPPRGTRTMAVLRWILVLASVALAAASWASWGASGRASRSAATSPKYHCPMHPTIVSDVPGECPICHMALEPIGSGRSAATPDDAAANVTAAGDYVCPMHPEVRSNAPGRCPICKMSLARVVPDASVPATTAITLSLDRAQAIGVRTAVAEERLVPGTQRLTAVVAEPEDAVAEVHVRAPGFVERLHVAESGVRVRAGEPLAAVYSPEIFQAQHELLAAAAWIDGGASGAAARTKLELLGMSRAEIDRVATTREVLRTITVTSPRAGFVRRKAIVLGAYVTPEAALYEIQDLSRVWIVADVPLARPLSVASGRAGTFTPAGQAGRVAKGKIDLVYPVASVDARTQRVRMPVDNPDGRRLAPGEYGVLELEGAPQTAVTVPADALVTTGSTTYVFIAEGDSRYAPRAVVAAGADADRVAITEGLMKGERVVSGATFLIDSESRLRASFAEAARASGDAAR